MINNTTLVEILALIENKSKEKMCTDDTDFNAGEWSGGNFDDAYQLGLDDGAVGFAKRLQSILTK